MEQGRKTVSSRPRLATGWVITLVIVAVVLIFGGSFIHYSNSLNSAKQDFEQQQGDLQSALQRRNDLVPNLVSSVKGSMSQERKVFGDIAKARENYSSAAKSGSTKEQANANAQLSGTTSNLINLINERYPKLASNDNVRRLMDQLEGSENRINLARRRYNQSIKTYNNKVVRFPSSMVANMKGMQTKEYFQADKNAQTVPKVDLEQ